MNSRLFLLPSLSLSVLLLPSCEVQTTEEEQAAIRESIENKVNDKLALPELSTLADAGVVTTVSVEGMTCQNCALKIYDSLTTLPGFVAEEINVETGEVKIGFQKRVPEQSLIQVAVESAGYSLGASPAETTTQ